jgi:nitrogen fixation NifU-like protein
MKLPDKVIEHFSNPQNVGQIENPEGRGTITNPICGDITELYLQIKDGVITDCKFRSFGCAVTIASASVLTGKVKGMKISQLLSMRDDEIINQLVGLIESELGELPHQKLHCPPGTVQAFLEAIMGYCEKQGESQVATRIKKMLPLLDEYYKRQKKAEESP